jgi:Prophage tail length tape measure protein
VDIARLGLAVDSTQVEKGTVSLHQFTGAAGHASAAAHKLAGASQAEATGHKAATAATQAHTAALAAQNAVMRSNSTMRTNMIFQLNDVGVSLASGMNPGLVALQQGSQILQYGVGPALRTIGDLAKSLVTRFLPVGLAVGVVTAAFAAMTTEINRTAETQVSIIDVMLASWLMFSEFVAGVFSPLVSAAGQLWDWLSPHIVSVVNALIGAFDLGVRDIKTIWSLLPAAIGDSAIQAANGVIGAIDAMLGAAGIKMHDFLSFAAGALAPFGLGGSLNLLAMESQLKSLTGAKTELPNPYAGAGRAFDRQIAQNRLDVGSTDYVGQIGARAQEIAKARAEVEALEGAAGAANDNFKSLGQTMSDAARAAAAEWNFYRDTFSGFFADLKSGLKHGQSLWESLGNAGASALDKIADRALNMAANGIFDLIFGSLMRALGGGAGLGMGAIGRGVYGGGGGFFPGFPGMADGGTVGRSGLSWVGERGPELLRLPEGAQVIPNGPSMAMAANSNAASGDVVFNNHMQIMPGATEEDGAAFARGFNREMKRQMPGFLKEWQRNDLRRAG